MKAIHIDLSDISPDFQEGEWVEVRNPLGWTQRRIRQWQKIEDEDEQKQEEFLRWLITAWHVVDQDSGAWMNDPASDDLGGITPGHILAIREALKRPFRGSLAAAVRGGPDLRVVDGDTGGAPTAA